MTSALPAALLIHTATRIRPSTSTNAHGDTDYNYTVPPASSATLTGRFEQNKATEPISDGRQPLIREWTFFTNESDVRGRDRIIFGSLTFEVDGPPAPAYGASAFHHGEVQLRLVEG